MLDLPSFDIKSLPNCSVIFSESKKFNEKFETGTTCLLKCGTEKWIYEKSIVDTLLVFYELRNIKLEEGCKKESTC